MTTARGPIAANSTLAELVELSLRQLRADSRLEDTTIKECERVLSKLVIRRSLKCRGCVD